MTAKISQTDAALLWARQLLDSKQALDLGFHSAFLSRLPDRRRSRRFAWLNSPPGERPLPLKRMPRRLTNEEDSVFESDDSSNKEKSF